MHKKSTRTKALLVGAMMAVSSLSFSSFATLTANAAITSASSINKTLATSIQSDDPDHPENETECTFMCAQYDDMYVAFSDTTGTGPETFLGTSDITSLQLHFKLSDDYDEDYVVSQFTYYFGVSADEDCPYKEYWWDTGADYYDNLREAGHAGSMENSIECHPCSREFYVTIYVPSEALAQFNDSQSEEWDNPHFQIQNCYTQLSTESRDSIGSADIILVDIIANGTTDTSEADEETQAKYVYDEGEPAPQNTGGLWYSSILYSTYSSGYNSITTSSDGTTFTAVNTLRVDYSDDPIAVTPGDGYSEEDYTDEDGNSLSEAQIRANGDPINSHKFQLADFGLDVGTNTTNNVTVKSMSVTFSVDDATDITRFMYGGGISVSPKSVADTEWAKIQAGLKEASAGVEGGYWYNDVGNEDWAAVLALEEEGYSWTLTDAYGNLTDVDGVFAIDVESGTNLTNRHMGTYFTVTWDVPEQVQPYVDLTGSISFQLWYMEDDGTVSNAAANIVSASLTYEETVTTTKDIQSATYSTSTKGSVGDSVSINYSDVGLEYEKTADVYAILFEVSTDADVARLLLGSGTSVVESFNSSYWYQADDYRNEGTAALLNYTDTDVDSRESSSTDTSSYAEYVGETGRGTYEYLWILPASVPFGTSTEQEGDHFDFGVWYANANETEASTYTITSATVYYVADDTDNGYKMALREGNLYVYPETMYVIEGTSSQPTFDSDGNVVYNDDGSIVVGDDAIVEVSVTGCTAKSSQSAVKVSVGSDGYITVTANDGSAGVTVTITVTTPGKQTTTFTVEVVSDTDPNATTTTETTTTETTTTTTITTTTTTSGTDDTTSSSDGSTTMTTEAEATIIGDVNLDGTVSLADSVQLNKFVGDLVELNGTAMKNADCNSDDGVGAADALSLLRFLVQLAGSLPE